ncbi:hypothetical protein DEM27_22160 [Metarhizobium album]|uniref:Uncharacterized protein n=1 Tax=Metarhizobium album TaxID=2182425 RepID=A0A2U2DL43_9HYPH|nr:hypothetical protein [Rhizobium album]PWE54025.1 hypothetical protein DEM27_22160 [Rhizobium album]
MTELKDIPGPRQHGAYPERAADCRSAIEPAYMDHTSAGTEDEQKLEAGELSDVMIALSNRARHAGWSAEESDAAIAAIAAQRVAGG